jgi:phosphoribosylformylglycinamidine (FGAM) synthase PurS component
MGPNNGSQQSSTEWRWQKDTNVRVAKYIEIFLDANRENIVERSLVEMSGE